MKPIHNLIIISAALLLALPSIGAAAEPHAGAYVSGFIGVSVPGDSDVTTDYFDNSPSVRDQVEFDPGINIGGTGGYDFGYVRLEGEVSYKYSEISSLYDQTNNVRYHNPDGSLGVSAFMANVFFDLHNESRVTPYLGGGIGFAVLNLSDTFGTSAAGREYLYGEDDDAVFAYQVGAGVEIALNRIYSLDIGYRYFGTDTANFNNDFDQASRMKFESHNVIVGFRATF
jgi:opacity protein-like surface antigen